MAAAARVAAQRHLQALRDGIILTMPLIIIGSVFLILAFLPIPGYEEFMAGTFGEQWLTKLLYPVGATFDIMALIAAFGIAYRLAQSYKVDALTAGAVSVAAFLLATPFNVSYLPEGASQAVVVGGVIPSALMGSKGLFVSMILAILSTELFRVIIQKNLVIKMPAGVPPNVSRSFTALIPGFIILTAVWLLRLFIETTSFESLHNVVGELLGKPLGVLGGSLIGSLVAVILIQLLWSSGLHGASIVGGVMGPIWLTSMDQNRLAYQAGEPVSNIFTQQFFDIFVYVGGSGATLSLVFCMLFLAKSQQMKQLGRLSVGPGLFNINEPVTFGMPIVMNPLLIIPFILTPVVITIVTYSSMAAGFVAKPAGIAVPWTMPPLFGGYLSTGGKLSGLVMQLVNMIIAFSIYYPFFCLWDRQKYAEETSSSAK